jgi:hypothetical protein
MPGTSLSRPQKRLIITVVSAVVVLIAVLGTLAIIPISHSFAMSVGQGTVNQSWPSGATIQFNWHTSDGASHRLTVSHSLFGQFSYLNVYDQTAASGTDTFTSDGAAYTFTCYCNSTTGSPTIVLSGTASYPIL